MSIAASPPWPSKRQVPINPLRLSTLAFASRLRSDKMFRWRCASMTAYDKKACPSNSHAVVLAIIAEQQISLISLIFRSHIRFLVAVTPSVCHMFLDLFSIFISFVAVTDAHRAHLLRQLAKAASWAVRRGAQKSTQAVPTRSPREASKMAPQHPGTIQRPKIKLEAWNQNLYSKGILRPFHHFPHFNSLAQKTSHCQFCSNCPLLNALINNTQGSWHKAWRGHVCNKIDNQVLCLRDCPMPSTSHRDTSYAFERIRSRWVVASKESGIGTFHMYSEAEIFWCFRSRT